MTANTGVKGSIGNIGIREMDRLIDWMRRTGHPQTIESITRRYIEMLREERGIKNK